MDPRPRRRLSAAASSLTVFLSVALLNTRSVTADVSVAGHAAAPSSAMTTVLPPKEAEALFGFSFNGDSLFGKQDRHHKLKETFWTPTTADVAQAEAALAAYAQTARAADPKREGAVHWPLSAPVTGYYRQYAGVMRGDRRCVLINGFAPPVLPMLAAGLHGGKNNGDWHDRAVLVCDGGFAFFHTAYDPAAHRIKSLEFNGFA